MKKSLLALAVLGAFASAAQAQVTIGGVIQADLKDYKISNTNATRVVAPTNELRIDDDYTSRFWLTGTEDLGGGVSALFYVENRLNTDVGSVGVSNGLANGDTFVGLKGGFGQATVGRHSLMYTQGFGTEGLAGNGNVVAIPSSALATFSILSYAGLRNVSESRFANSIKYTTPNFGGFSGSLGYSTASAASEGQTTQGLTAASTNANPDYAKGQAFVLTGNYTNGPIYLNAAYMANNTEGHQTCGAAVTAAAGSSVYLTFPGCVAGQRVVTQANADTRQVRVSGSYKFPFGLKVGAQIDKAQLKDVGANSATGTSGSSNVRTAWEIPVSYAFGSSTLLGSYTHAGSLSNTSGNTGAKMYTLGYDYALSKRTNVAVFYSKIKNDAATPGVALSGGVYQPYLAGTSGTGSALLPGESAATISLGVKHTF
jgi:predicted porin